MNTVRTILRRLFGDEPADQTVHFHRRGETAEPCYDGGCTLPHLTV